MAGPALTDVPDRYDVVFQLNNGNTYGFLLADSVESNLPFRTHKALYSYSPTFLERQNVSQQYGDNFQDFFLTGSQDDFSLGEQQKFFRVNDQNRSRRYWGGRNVEPVDVPGDVTLTTTLASAASSVGTIATPFSLAVGSDDWWTADVTNLYSVSRTLAVTTVGAHGCTGPVSIAVDYKNVYIAGSSGAGIRKWDGASFSTFSTTLNITSLAFVNNILFGYQQTTDSFISFDTSGTPTTQFQWKNADGAGVSTTNRFIKLVPYGGDIYIIRSVGQTVELWKYDGSGVRKLADLQPDFNMVQGDACVAQGIVFFSGVFIANTSSNTYQPAIFFYANGSMGQLWKAPAAVSNSSTSVPMCAFGNGVIFKDPITGNIYQYDLAAGGIHCIENFSRGTVPEPSSILVPSNINSAFLLLYSDRIVTYRGSANYNSTGYIQTSQYDFDNTLSKVMRAIKVDADIPANTSVDIAYQLDGCGGTYTALATGITSGTEYLLPASTSAHSISVQITLNSATGSATPTLKRVYVRAAPMLQQFRRREFLFDLSGGLREEIGKSARRNRDNTPYPYDPKTAANNLRTIATQTIPFTVQDRFDQFTCIADLQQNQEGYDGFAIYEIRPDVFIGRINLREV